ncbi:MAG: hypothetical protein QOF52_2964 [Propionibacteriaceae bacterium]|jgi:NADPH-dependent ferric siderophore reductase|nr:siderophore-interacting protein [Propionibacteriaceae bacterium]MDX6323106.1 hypothetical protein [Propionibacteriaceae bacterium]
MTSTTRSRSSYRPFAVTVTKRTVLGPHFIRITLTGDDLDRCGDTCLDQRLKLIFAGPELVAQFDRGSADPDFDWYAWWLQLDAEQRPPMRTYTARSVRQDLRQVDIDFACHGANGPASRFALTAVAGDRLIMVGPDRDVPQSVEQGITWRPGAATEVMLAGDETAVPAICSILESLPAGVAGHAFLEVVDRADIQPITTASGVVVRWLPRHRQPIGSRLAEAVYDWSGSRASQSVDTLHPSTQLPEGSLLWEEADAGSSDGPYVWLAGEAGAINGLRRHLASDVALDKIRMSFMGYWKMGRAAVG